MVACHCLNGSTCDRQGFDSPWRYVLFASLARRRRMAFLFRMYLLFVHAEHDSVARHHEMQ